LPELIENDGPRDGGEEQQDREDDPCRPFAVEHEVDEVGIYLAGPSFRLTRALRVQRKGVDSSRSQTCLRIVDVAPLGQRSSRKRNIVVSTLSNI
jgi:hypothetical protein